MKFLIAIYIYNIETKRHYFFTFDFKFRDYVSNAQYIIIINIRQMYSNDNYFQFKIENNINEK